MEQNHNWYATIQSRILCATDISANQKLLIALISNLSNAKGYCFASNEYLGKRLNIKKDSVRKLLTDLEDKKYITRVIKLRADYSVEFRALTIIERYDNPTTFDVEDEVNTPQDKNLVPPGQISPTPQINILDPQDESAYIITEVNNKVNIKEKNLCKDIPKEEILETIEDITNWCSINQRNLGTNNPIYFVDDKIVFKNKPIDIKIKYLTNITTSNK
jgi:hypothetical protein